MEGIYFPGLGISLPNVPTGFKIFGLEIKFYGLIIAVGFVLALKIAMSQGKKTGLTEENYIDYFLWMIIPTILGARIYYILFNLKEYVGEGISFGESLRRMIDIRNGGLAIYGGIIAGVIVSWIFTKKKKIYLPQFADNITYGILIGQIMGRWGNFFNREVFGSYTDSFIRMAIPVDYYRSHGSLSYLQSTGVITDTMMQNTETVNELQCITVVPSFLLEGLWNLGILIFLFWYRKRKRFDGELSMIYILGYGIGRFLIEGNRTDSLMVGPLKVSQVVAVLCVITALAVLIRNYMKLKAGYALPCHRPVSGKQVEESGATKMIQPSKKAKTGEPSHGEGEPVEAGGDPKEEPVEAGGDSGEEPVEKSGASGQEKNSK